MAILIAFHPNRDAAPSTRPAPYLLLSRCYAERKNHADFPIYMPFACCLYKRNMFIQLSRENLSIFDTKHMAANGYSIDFHDINHFELHPFDANPPQDGAAVGVGEWSHVSFANITRGLERCLPIYRQQST